MKTIGRAFFQLLKPRVMSLVVFTGWVGLMLAPGAVHPFLAFMIIFHWLGGWWGRLPEYVV